MNAHTITVICIAASFFWSLFMSSTRAVKLAQGTYHLRVVCQDGNQARLQNAACAALAVLGSINQGSQTFDETDKNPDVPVAGNSTPTTRRVHILRHSTRLAPQSHETGKPPASTQLRVLSENTKPRYPSFLETRRFCCNLLSIHVQVHSSEDQRALMGP